MLFKFVISKQHPQAGNTWFLKVLLDSRMMWIVKDRSLRPLQLSWKMESLWGDWQLGYGIQLCPSSHIKHGEPVTMERLILKNCQWKIKVSKPLSFSCKSHSLAYLGKGRKPTFPKYHTGNSHCNSQFLWWKNWCHFCSDWNLTSKAPLSPWLGWLSGVSAGLRIKGSLVRFPV